MYPCSCHPILSLTAYNVLLSDAGGLGGHWMTSEGTYELEFELLDLDNLSSHVSLSSKCHNSQNVGTVIYPHG